MRKDLRWKGITILLTTLAFVLVLYFLPIRLGLDLKGGIELLLAPDYRVGSNVVYRLGDVLSEKAKSASITGVEVSPLGTLDGDRYEGLKFTFASANDVQRALNADVIPNKYQITYAGETKNLNLTKVIKGNVVEVTVLQAESDFPSDSLQRSLAIIDHRINQASSGMAEADVRLDGKGRINVQLPGIESLSEAKELIVATGRLTFRINNKIVLDGTDMKEVYVSMNQTEGYVINFEFKGDGARQLAKVTSENVGKPMSIYLDEEELMAPIIKSALSEGSGYITLGSRNKEEVENYAILMKSGALPISLRVVQSTQVAPTLGKEIVKQSMLAGIIGVILVMGFMVVFYSFPGLMANLALMLYVIFVLGVMALFRGVLTLPGVAGVILGVGMAVDANVLIFERIKDEARMGKRLNSALNSGFDRALVTIIDSNITTLIAAVVLFVFGSGSIQGFAVTLTIGIVVSMFTAVFVSRFLLDWRIDKAPEKYAGYFGIKEVNQ